MILPYGTLRNGLVAAWCPSRGATGSLVRDSAGIYNATISAATWQAMTGGLTLAFNGSSAAATNTAVQERFVGATLATQTAWMWKSAANTTAATGFSSSVPASAAGVPQRFGVIWFTDGNAYCFTENQSTGYGVYANNVAGWMHIAILFDGTQNTNATRQRVFINGNAVTASSIAGTIAQSLGTGLGDYTLGKDSSDRFGAGRLDDVRLYNRLLTHSEIRLLASQRGIGLTPQRARRLQMRGSQFWLRDAGTWKKATGWIKVNGVWTKATPKIRVSGAYK